MHKGGVRRRNRDLNLYFLVGDKSIDCMACGIAPEKSGGNFASGLGAVRCRVYGVYGQETLLSWGHHLP